MLNAHDVALVPAFVPRGFIPCAPNSKLHACAPNRLHACNGVQVGVLSKELWAKLLALAKPSAGQKGAAVHLGLAEWELAKPLEGGLEIAESPALDEGIQLNREDRTALADEALNEYAQFFFTADDN
jgi:hypothetical protein